MSFDDQTKHILNSMPFSSCSNGTKASKVKKIFTFIHSYEIIAKTFPLAEEKIRQIIILNLK